jgi:hypothetical protein
MRRIAVSLLVFVFAFFVFSVSSISAKVITDEKGTVNIGKTEVINDDLFVGAQTVEIAGTVNGDVFIGAQTVKISGIINGSLHIGANTIDLGGTVKGNVYAGAQNVLIGSSKIGGSLLVGAATVNIDKNTTIGGSIMAGAGAITIDSQIKRSVYAGTGSLTIGENTRIGKDLYYADDSTQGQANISPSAKIAGNIYKSEVDTAKANINVKRQIPVAINGARIFTAFISFVGALIVGFLYFKLFTGHSNQVAGIVSKSFWKSLGVGFLVTIAFVPGLIILLITVIGIPVAGLAFLMLLLYGYLAKIVIGSVLGAWISNRFNWKVSAYWTFAIGLFVIYLVRMIPFVGPVCGGVVLWTGLGALTLRMFSKSN